MRILLPSKTNRKGVSEMVSYVLLIVIAVGLALAVYGFIQLYIPKGQSVDCGPDVSLIIQNLSCDRSSQQVSVVLVNKGLFKVDGVYARFDKATKRIKFPLDSDTTFKMPDGTIKTSLLPGEVYSRVYTTSRIDSVNADDYVLEIQPAKVVDNGKFAVCQNAIITQQIHC